MKHFRNDKYKMHETNRSASIINSLGSSSSGADRLVFVLVSFNVSTRFFRLRRLPFGQSHIVPKETWSSGHDRRGKVERAGKGIRVATAVIPFRVEAGRRRQ